MAKATGNIQEFFAKINSEGFDAVNRFEVIITLPPILSQELSGNPEEKKKSIFDNKILKEVKKFLFGSKKDVDSLTIMCESVELPGKAFATAEAKYNGDYSKIPYGNVYIEIQSTFLVSRELYEKVIFDKWANLIISPEDFQVNYMEDFVSPKFVINKLDRADNVVYSLVLKNAYPLSVSPINLSQGDSAITKLNVQWSFSKWFNEDIESKDGSLVDSLRQTPLGPILEPFLSNPAVSKSLDYLKDKGFDLEGEGANYYNKIDEVVRNTTGKSINQSSSILNGMKVDIGLNERVRPSDKDKLNNIINGVLRRF
jgi:hypothetical protein